MSNLLARYDELLAVKLGDSERLKEILNQQQHVILAIDGLQPDMGHEVLWVIRDCPRFGNSLGTDPVVGRH